MVVLKEMNKMFWGLTIDSGRCFSQTVDKGFHVSMAALEINPEAPGNVGHVQVMVKHETSQFLLCTLGPNQLQQELDLCFGRGETIEFFLSGTGVVHLTGSLMPEEDYFQNDITGNMESEDEELELPSLLDYSVASEASSDGSSKPRSAEPPFSVDYVDSDASSDGSYEPPRRIKMTANGMTLVTDDDSSLLPLEEFFSDFHSDSDDEAMEKKKDKGKSPASSSKASETSTKRARSEDSSSEPSSPLKKKKKKDRGAKTGDSQSAEAEASATGDAPSGDTTTKKKKKKKKNKQENVQQQQQSSAEQPAESSSSKPSPAVGKKRTVSGGTSVEDVKIGHGPEAKPGTTVSVYYAGTLAKNNKRFDSCLKGKPFRFRLGRGEVIKGWDTGLIGMKVGGKRKITVPPSQGYGNSRQGPIPPGSTLVFDVEMKAVN